MDYWQQQSNLPLFGEIDRDPPEQKQFAGRILVLGGHSGAFFTPISTAESAKNLGFATVRTLLPESIKKQIPAAHSTPELIFAPASPSGGFSKDALAFWRAAADDADFTVIIGDLGRNAETVTTLAQFMAESDRLLVLTRDAIDLIAPDAARWITHEKLTLLATLPQLQKLFRAVFYPKMITLSMPLNQLAETLHKFTLSYPLTVATYHQDQIIVAGQGTVVTTPISDTKYTPISLWDGQLATQIAALQVWNPDKILRAITTALLPR